MGHYFSLSIVSLCWLVFPSCLLQGFYVAQEMGVVPSVLGVPERLEMRLRRSKAYDLLAVHHRCTYLPAPQPSLSENLPPELGGGLRKRGLSRIRR